MHSLRGNWEDKYLFLDKEEILLQNIKIQNEKARLSKIPPLLEKATISRRTWKKIVPNKLLNRLFTIFNIKFDIGYVNISSLNNTIIIKALNTNLLHEGIDLANKTLSEYYNKE